jgi:hypothetical protein
MVYREKLSNLSDLKLFVSNGGGTPEPVEMAGLKGWGARMPTKITEGDRLSNVLMAKFHSEAQGHFSFHRNDIFLLLEYRLSGTSTDEDDAVFRAKNEQLLSEAEKILKTVRIIGSPDEATQAAPAATTGVGPAKSA